MGIIKASKFKNQHRKLYWCAHWGRIFQFYFSAPHLGGISWPYWVNTKSNVYSGFDSNAWFSSLIAEVF
jgi:hypothetical protein